MGLLDTKKPGLSNGLAQQQGLPTSGEVSANAGALPAQRAQQPFEHTRAQSNGMGSGGGTLNGGAVQGAQYKTNAQQLSPGVASFIAIPSGMTPGGFQQPSASIPGGNPIPQQTVKALDMTNQQPSYVASQQQANAKAKAAAAAAQAAQAPPNGTPGSGQSGAYNNFGQRAQPNLQPPVATAPMPYDYQAEMNKIGQGFDRGSAYDLNARAQLAEKQRNMNMAGQAQDALLGRGATVGQANRDYAALTAQTDYEAQRAGMEQAAHQQQFANQMGYAKSVVDIKGQLALMARQMDLQFDDADFNKMAGEMVSQYGGQPTPGSMLEAIQKNAKSPAAGDSMKVLSSAINNGDGATIVASLSKLSKADLKKVPAEWWNKALSESWGDDDTKIRQMMVDAGIPIPN